MNRECPSWRDLPFIPLHQNENLYGMSQALVAALKAPECPELWRYPSEDAEPLRSEIAAFYCISREQVVLANGSQELMLMSLAAFLAAPEMTCVATAQTFPGYLLLGKLLGKRLVQVPLRGEGVDLDLVLAAVRREHPRLVVIINPHNPCGTIITLDALEAFVRTCPAETVVIVDEAYAEFAPLPFRSALELVRKGLPVIVSRTFSKAYGVPGIRLGYAMGRPDLIRELGNALRLNPFSVNQYALYLGRVALRDQEGLQHVIAANAASNQQVSVRATALGLRVIPSFANFVLIACPQAAIITQRLFAHHGLRIRDTASFGLPGYIRITLGPRDLMDFALDALSTELSRLAAEESPPGPPV